MRPNKTLLISILISFIVLRIIIFPVQKESINSTLMYSDMGKNNGIFPQMRGLLSAKVDSLYPSSSANLVKGLLLGINELDKDFKKALINTGTIHVVVVSGFNVALVASALLTLGQFLGRKKALLISLIGILVYTLLTGAQPPTIRAAIMGSLAFGAQALGRPKESRELLALSGFLMLLISPGLITDLSFQLSFIATFGVIQFSPWFLERFKKIGPLKGDLANTLGAQTLVVPLLFFHFGQVSLVAPLVNVLVLWTVPLATILGFISLGVSFVFYPLGQLLAWGNYVFLLFFITVIEISKNVPILPVAAGNWFFLFGYYLVLVGLAMSLRAKRGNPKEIASSSSTPRKDNKQP